MKPEGRKCKIDDTIDLRTEYSVFNCYTAGPEGKVDGLAFTLPELEARIKAERKAAVEEGIRSCKKYKEYVLSRQDGSDSDLMIRQIAELGVEEIISRLCALSDKGTP